MTWDEFVEGYAERSGIEVEKLLLLRQPYPCDCGEGGCEGWQMLSPSSAFNAWELEVLKRGNLRPSDPVV